MSILQGRIRYLRQTWRSRCDKGIALGQTSQMQEVVEVYQTDIGKVREEGQQAIITSSHFPINYMEPFAWLDYRLNKKLLAVNRRKSRSQG